MILIAPLLPLRRQECMKFYVLSTTLTVVLKARLGPFHFSAAFTCIFQVHIHMVQPS